MLLEPGDCVINCPPTFGMYPFDTLLNAGQVVEVPRRADFSLDLPAIQAAVRNAQPKADLYHHAQQPGWQPARPGEIECLLALPLLVVLDEAYIEFASQGGRLGERLSRIQQVPERDNLVVLRTFSKWAGLAGLRVGYGAFPAWLMPALWKAKQPYNVNVAASGCGHRLAAGPGLSWPATWRCLRRNASACLTGCRPDLLPATLPLPGQLHPVPGARPPGQRAERRPWLHRASWSAITTPPCSKIISASVSAGRKTRMR